METKTKIIVAIMIVVSVLSVYMLSGTKKMTITNEIQEVKEEPKIEIDTIAKYIYQQESSSGVNCYSLCKTMNKMNCIGYGIWKDKNEIQHYTCFDNYEQQMEVLKTWINDRIEEGLNIHELLCYYNTGKIQEKCKYIKNWWGVDNFIK